MNANLILTVTGQSNDVFLDLFRDPVIWMAIFVGIFLLFTLSVVNKALNVMKEVSLKAQGRWTEADEKGESQSAIMQALTAAVPVDREEEVMTDHEYDGIKELDNRLPPWWLYGFYASIIFAGVYLFQYHIIHSKPLSAEEYQNEVAEAEAAIAAKRSSSGVAAIDADNVTVLTDAASLTAGADIFNSFCVACHAAGGAGQTGPNLTDEFWINGGGIKNVFNTITNGGRKGTAMIPWRSQLSPTKIQQVASYVLSLEGTNPPNAKAAEGEKWVDTAAPVVEETTDSPETETAE